MWDDSNSEIRADNSADTEGGAMLLKSWFAIHH